VPEGDDGLEAGEDAGLLLHLPHGCLVNLFPYNLTQSYEVVFLFFCRRSDSAVSYCLLKNQRFHGRQPVFRIRDVYFIPDPKTATKERDEKIVVLAFYVPTKVTEFKIILFLKR
jgi:hypothetical protein